ncbi:MAG TPA: hypothetical protein VNE84_07855 [Candidatus Limnocylindria bacterium]|jgi:hypothetical protein|nr:hypothetical protein [Candidatus Limnocylindria bacterium]
MKTKSLKISSAIVIAFFVLGTTVYAQGTDTRIGTNVIEAQAITKEDAQKKYPPPSNGYPAAQRDPHEKSGNVTSPYPPYQKYDCSKIAHGALVLDIRAKKVFVRP